jgi:thioredoxin-like negative regulator of GroEL
MLIKPAQKIIPTTVWNDAMSYSQYNLLLENLLEKGQTTGTQQTPERIEHARLNLARMSRIYNHFEPDKKTLDILKQKSDSIRMLFIVEGWCGDAAQIVPALEKIVAARGWDSRYILRDENPEVMDMFLTHGTRSIPIVVAIDKSGEVLQGHWGPRPALLADLVSQWKIEMSKHDWHKLMHTWYAKDKANTLQGDFGAWVNTLA